MVFCSATFYISNVVASVIHILFYLYQPVIMSSPNSYLQNSDACGSVEEVPDKDGLCGGISKASKHIDPSYTQKASSSSNLNVVKQVGPGPPTCVDDFLTLLQTYQMELDADSSTGRLPRCFVREFGNDLQEYVMLRDPNNNEFEVRVVKRDGEIYFDEGWVSLKDAYNICFGAWVTITYVGPKFLRIRLLTRWGAEVNYPCSNPPLRHLLYKSGTNCSLGSSVMSSCSPGSTRPRSLIRSYVKEMTLYDAHSGTLLLPWYGFGQSAFAFVFSDLILVDNAGNQYQCLLGFGVDDYGELACKVTGGWADLCAAHDIAPGDRVKFSIAHYSASNVMYVCVYPRTMVQAYLNGSGV